MNLQASTCTEFAGECPTVTVYMAAFNASEYIVTAIESVLSQSYPNTHLVVVDDCSSDNTFEILKRYEATGRVHALRNEINSGPARCRNRAIAESRGEWLLQLDADDWMAPSRVDRLTRLAARYDADIVADDQVMVLSGTRKIATSRLIESGLRVDHARIVSRREFVDHDLGSIKPMLKAAVVKGLGAPRYPEDIRYGEDFIFLFRLLSGGAKMVVTEEPMYFLRRGDTGSLTRQRDELFVELVRGTKSLAEEMREIGDVEGERMLLDRLRVIRFLGAAESIIRARGTQRWRLSAITRHELRAIAYKALNSTASRFRRGRYLSRKSARAIELGL